MLDDRIKFEKRLDTFKKFGDHAAFCLSAVYGSMEKIKSLGEEGIQVVATRSGEYREWDPETIKVDEVAEGYFLQCIDNFLGKDVTILSEEVGKVRTKEKPELYVVSDPFDGSLLYKRKIPAFWYTTIAMYSKDGEPLAAAVCDVPNESVDFANEEKAYTGKFFNDKLYDLKEIKPSNTKEIEDSVLETYMMKVPRFYPAAYVWEPLFSKVKFILPNGGPAGFADTAKGNIDIYLALEEAMIENFSALPIALKAGAVVTDFDGNEIKFNDDINIRYFILCSANNELHEKVLNEIQRIDWKNNEHYKKILEEK